jgi:hypothetical protein
MDKLCQICVNWFSLWLKSDSKTCLQKLSLPTAQSDSTSLLLKYPNDLQVLVQLV